MKVYISADMEGVSGLVEAHDTQPGGLGYASGCRYMTEDVNAAIRGAYVAGATEVVVNDAHGPMRNIMPELLDSRAILIRGKSKPFGMIEGLSGEFDAVLCVGFHARAGRLGVLSHSFMGHEVEDMWLDEVPVGEIGMLQAAAASWSVPVVMLSGDDAACSEAMEHDDAILTVQVKRVVDRFSAELMPLEAARSAIELAAERSLQSLRSIGPTESISTLRIRWQSASVATHLTALPGVTLCDERTIEVSGAVLSLYRQMFIFFRVAASFSHQQPYC